MVLRCGHAGTAFETGKLTVQVKDDGAGDRDHAANGSLLVTMAAGASVHAQKHQNQLNAMDVNGDEFISPLDALLIINNLNTSGARALGAMPSPLPSTFNFLDPSGDGYVSPLDALLIINQLNSRPSGEGEQNLAMEDRTASQDLQSYARAPAVEHPNAEIAWAYDWYTDLADEASGGWLFGTEGL